MKIQCDVCDKDEASVFCVADEAALCAACDRRVHHANKLAGRHQRFSLLHSSAKHSPICDICQEKRAFLFCQQDRAILCRECDVSIHKANEHTQKHARFLLTGLKLSSTSTIYSSPSESPSSTLTDTVPNLISKASEDESLLPSRPNIRPSTRKSATVVQKPCSESASEGNLVSSSISPSSISEYLIETLPGWHVEELLDSTNFASPDGFIKSGENDVVLPFWDADLESNLSAFPSGKMGLWVPQVPPPLNQNIQKQSYQDNKQVAFGIKEFGTINTTRKWSQESSLVVPQISASKKLRSTFC